MFQDVLTGIVVFAAFLYVIYFAYKSIAEAVSNKASCGCGSSGCSEKSKLLKDINPNKLKELKMMNSFKKTNTSIDLLLKKPHS